MTDPQLRRETDRPGDVVVPSDESAPPSAVLGKSADVRRLLESYGMSHAGRVRAVNEDHFVTATLQRTVQLRQTNLDDPRILDRLAGPRAYLYAVADGVGGSSGGRVASALTVGTMIEYLGEVVGWYDEYDASHPTDFREHLKMGVQRAHDRLVETFRLQDKGGPATTLSLVMIVWPTAYIVHVGDSRVYHLRGDAMHRLTRDQTVGDVLVTQHGMPREKAEQAGLYNMLASAVGAQDMTPAVDAVSLERGDTLLLCTDGLTKHVSDARITETLSLGVSAESACRALVDMALTAGGSDNVTAVVARALGG